MTGSPSSVPILINLSRSLRGLAGVRAPGSSCHAQGVLFCSVGSVHERCRSCSQRGRHAPRLSITPPSLERAFEPVSTVPLGRKAGSLRGLWFALLFCSATEPNTASHGACCSDPVSTAGMATAESPYAAVLAALERELRPAPSPGFRSRALSLQALTAACVLSSLSRPSCACRLNLAPARRYIVLSLVYLAFLRYCAERSPHLSTPLPRRVRRRLLSELRRS